LEAHGLTYRFSRKVPLEMTSDPTRDKFLLKWRAALRDRETGERSYWEGQKAYSDLQRTGYLGRVRLEETGRDEKFGSDLDHRFAHIAVREICAVLAAYRLGINQVRKLIDFQKDQEEWLEKHATAFSKKANRVAKDDPLLAHDLGDLAKRISKINRATHFRLEKRWHPPYLSFAHPIEDRNKLHQERQLDSQFQARLGSIFRGFMPKNPISNDKDANGPSSRTIARLVVLFLVCADLASIKEGIVELKHNSHRITVGGVLQQLTGAGIDRKS
jgi:hypothetical protein